MQRSRKTNAIHMMEGRFTCSNDSYFPYVVQRMCTYIFHLKKIIIFSLKSQNIQTITSFSITIYITQTAYKRLLLSFYKILLPVLSLSSYKNLKVEENLCYFQKGIVFYIKIVFVRKKLKFEYF